MFSEETFKSIFNNAVDGILVVDIEQKCIFLANKVFCKLTGYNEEEVKGLTFKDVHREEDLAYVIEQFNLHADKTKQIAKNVPFLRKNKSIFYADVNSFEILIENKKFLVSILRDVTDRKNIVDELSFKTTLLETQLETTIDGILVVDDKSNILLYNQRFVDMWGIPQDLLDSKDDNFVLQYGTNLIKDPEEFKRKVIDLYYNKEQKSRDEIEFKDGRVFERYSAPMTSREGNYIGRIWYFRDISDYKKILDDLEKNKETFNLLMDVTNDAFWDWNMITNEVYRNHRHYTMLGYESHELSSNQYEWEKLIHPEDRNRVMKHLDDSFNGKLDPFRIEYRLQKKTGDYIWVLGRGKVVERDKEGNPLRMLGTYIDITELKQVEDRILKLSKAFEQTSEGIVLTDMEPRVQYVNKAWADMHGYTPEESVGKVIADLQTNEHKETFEKAIAHMLSNEGWTGETSHKRKDGTTFPIQMSVSILKNENGEATGFIGVARDVTELKKAEKALIESEQKYRTLVENAKVDIGSIDKDGRLLLINKKAAGRFGGEPEDNIGKTIWDLFPKEFADAFYKHILEVIENRQGINLELSPEIQGILSIHDASIEPLILPDTPVNSVMIISHEITDHKQAEQALRESEEKYRVLVENAGEAIVLINKEGEHLFMNTTAAQRLGGIPKDFIGKTMWDLFPKEIADREVADVKQVIETRRGKTIISENVIKGKTYWYEITIEPLITKSQPTALIISRDITERKTTEEALRESEERYRALVEGARETIAVLTEDGVFHFMNTTAAKRLGGNPENFIGKTMWDIFPKEIADRQIRSIRNVINTGKGETFVSQTMLQGVIFWYETTIEPLRNNEGQVYASLIIGRDITKFKGTQEELEIYREEVAHSERLASLGTLSATAAHELAQPLTVIRLLIENAMTKLQSTSSPEVVIDKLRESLNEITNITSVVDRLRKFARKSTEKSLKDVNFKTIANRIVNLLRESSLHPKVEMIIKDMDELPCIYSNEKDLEQLFFALLDNAIQAAGDKKGRQIIISGIDHGDHVELRFADNCDGIAPENIERIFEPFFTTKPPNQGTGLGLCIVRDVVSRFGGKIRVESELGEGTTFYVTLPLNNGLD